MGGVCPVQVPITKYLADALPSLAKFVAKGEKMTVMDALVDAVEALQVSEVAAAHPDYVESADRVHSRFACDPTAGLPLKAQQSCTWVCEACVATELRSDILKISCIL